MTKNYLHELLEDAALIVQFQSDSSGCVRENIINPCYTDSWDM